MDNKNNFYDDQIICSAYNLLKETGKISYASLLVSLIEDHEFEKAVLSSPTQDDYSM